MNDADLGNVARWREALASLDREGRAPLDAGRIFDALHGTLPPEDRRAVVDEVIGNPAAAEAWRLAKELAPVTSRYGFGISHGRAMSRWWWSAAAAAVLVLGVMWQTGGLWRSAETPVYRSIGQRAIASSLAPDQPLARSKPVLRWSAIHGARYTVTVLTPTLDVIAETRNLTTAEYVLSPDVLARFPPGTTLLWQVEAAIPGEGAIVSPTFSVRVE